MNFWEAVDYCNRSNLLWESEKRVFLLHPSLRLTANSGQRKSFLFKFVKSELI